MAPVTKFPSAPDSLLKMRAPNDAKPIIDSKPLEEHPRLEDVNAEIAQKAEELFQLARKLREFEETQIEKLKQEQKIALNNLKSNPQGGDQHSYNDQLVQLEARAQEVGNALEGLQASTSSAVQVLYRLNNYWIQLQSKTSERESKPDEYEVLKKILMQDIPREKLQGIYAKVQKIVQDGTQISYNLSKNLTGFPIRDDHRKGQVDLNATINDFVDEVYSLMSDLLQITTPIEDFLNRAEKVQRVDFSPNNQQPKAASYGR
jgi:hypothetical protein